MDSEVTDLAGIKAVTVSTLQVKPSEGAFADGDKTKLDGVEAAADVTDATNVAAAGAVMNTGNETIAGVKTFSSTISGSITGNAATATKIASITNSNIVQLTDTQTLTNKTLTSPTITWTGAIAGTFTGDVTGNADTATKIASITNSNIVQLAATQALTNKDLTGAGNTFPTFNQDTTGNAATATEAASVAANSVALGTDTTGNYVATLGSGTGVTIGSNTGEGSTPTIAVDYGSTANTAVEGDTTATFAGTTNEITVSDTSAQAIGGNIALTIGLPDDVTIGQDLTVTRDVQIGRNAVVSGNLTVAGTASFQNTQNLDVADRFIRMASGSTAVGDGGIVVQQDGPANGEAFAYDAATTRWSTTGSFDPSTEAYTPDAFVSAIVEGGIGVDTPAAVVAKYNKKGNIFVGANEDIYIYS